MPLPFQQQHVVAGQPVSANAWNDIVDHLLDLQEVVLKAGSFPLKVTVNGADTAAVDAARVVARSNSKAAVFQAAQKTVGGREFVFPQLPPDGYEIVASSPGCTEGKVSITLTDSGTPATAAVTLGSVTRMPTAIGKAWNAVVGQLPTGTHAFDTAGEGVPLSGYDPDYKDLVVLGQWPDPGEPVLTGMVPFVLVVAPVKQAAVVTVPNLIGMTVADARDQLEAVGLTLQVMP